MGSVKETKRLNHNKLIDDYVRKMIKFHQNPPKENIFILFMIQMDYPNNSTEIRPK